MTASRARLVDRKRRNARLAPNKVPPAPVPAPPLSPPPGPSPMEIQVVPPVDDGMPRRRPSLLAFLHKLSLVSFLLPPRTCWLSSTAVGRVVHHARWRTNRASGPTPVWVPWGPT